MKLKLGFPNILNAKPPLQVGFIPDTDSAPLAVARESGLFEQYELCVELKRESRWTTLRDKIIYGELDAAHAPATLPFITNLGLNSDQCASVTGLVLSLQGNTITVSTALHDAGVCDPSTLRDVIYRNWGRRTYTFGVEYPHSPAYFLLRQWLKSGDLEPQVEVRIVVVPTGQLFPMMKLGYIDGFCAGGLWSSLAMDAGIGTCVATSASLAPLHPEKVLMVRRDFAEQRPDEHERLAAALLEAAAFCDQPTNHALIAEMLAQPQYVNAPAQCIKEALAGFSDLAIGSGAAPTGASVFHRFSTNDPSDDKAVWLLDQLHESLEQGILGTLPQFRIPVIRNAFRHDIFCRVQIAVQKQKDTLQMEAERYAPRIQNAG
jgi:two-component system, oxyanion-binding sensor